VQSLQPIERLTQRKELDTMSEIERESYLVNLHYGEDIDEYQRELEI